MNLSLSLQKNAARSILASLIDMCSSCNAEPCSLATWSIGAMVIVNVALHTFITYKIFLSE